MKTTQEDYVSLFWVVYGGVGFAHSHARGPFLGFCGDAPGYSKINQNGIIINTGRAPEPFSSCFLNFEIFDFFSSPALPPQNAQNRPSSMAVGKTNPAKNREI